MLDSILKVFISSFPFMNVNSNKNENEAIK